MEPALRVIGLGKKFRHRVTDGPQTFRAWVEGGLRMPRQASFWALRGVAFDVAPGEMLGVIGRNGSGKSTLLRLLGGVMHPDEGDVVVSGPVNGLLELNTGMHPHLTGRENIIISGVLAGLLRTEVEARIASIIAFAELEDQIDNAVRTYSSGMKLRLGFAVAIHVDPTILLIDEVLAVGDIRFQQKCLARIREFKADGCAVVLISHDMGQIKTMCDRVLWIDGGEIRAIGRSDDVVAEFEGALLRETLCRTAVVARAPIDEAITQSRIGSGEVEFTRVRLLDNGHRPMHLMLPGEGFVVEAGVRFLSKIKDWRMSVTIIDRDGTICLDLNTEGDDVTLPETDAPMTLQLRMGRLDLRPGQYSVAVGLWQANWEYAYDYLSPAQSFEVAGSGRLKGVLSPPRSWHIEASKV